MNVWSIVCAVRGHNYSEWRDGGGPSLHIGARVRWCERCNAKEFDWVYLPDGPEELIAMREFVRIVNDRAAAQRAVRSACNLYVDTYA